MKPEDIEKYLGTKMKSLDDISDKQTKLSDQKRKVEFQEVNLRYNYYKRIQKLIVLTIIFFLLFFITTFTLVNLYSSFKKSNQSITTEESQSGPQFQRNHL